jgi:hypothetical protein
MKVESILQPWELQGVSSENALVLEDFQFHIPAQQHA